MPNAFPSFSQTGSQSDSSLGLYTVRVGFSSLELQTAGDSMLCPPHKAIQTALPTYPRGPCTPTGYSFGLKVVAMYCRYFGAKVHTIWVHVRTSGALWTSMS